MKDVPDWRLERFRLGELPTRDEAIVRAAAADPSLRARLAELDRSDREILAAHPPAAAAAAIRARLEQGSPTASVSRWRPVLAVATAATALALSIALPWKLPSSKDGRRDETRLKGLGPSLFLYRQDHSRPEPLADGMLARTHDVVQLVYLAAGRRYGVITSVDGWRRVTVHLPTDGAGAGVLAAGGPTPLAVAYELDDAPGFERFFFVTSAAPFEVEVVKRAVDRWVTQAPVSGIGAGRLDLPSSFDQFSLLLRKDPSR